VKPHILCHRCSLTVFTDQLKLKLNFKVVLASLKTFKVGTEVALKANNLAGKSISGCFGLKIIDKNFISHLLSRCPRVNLNKHTLTLLLDLPTFKIFNLAKATPPYKRAMLVGKLNFFRILTLPSLWLS